MLVSQMFFRTGGEAAPTCERIGSGDSLATLNLIEQQGSAKIISVFDFSIFVEVYSTREK